jgi:hypothetical protein
MNSRLLVKGLLCFSFFMLSACGERNIETRQKIAVGRDRITMAEDMAETGDYDYHRDNVWRQSYLARVEANRKERRRQQMIAAGMRDGTLMDKY